MLALPVITGFAGFLPSILLLVVFWVYMLYTALLILELNLSMEKNTNLISMAKNFGIAWRVDWMGYLPFLLYSLTTAYLAGSGPIIIEFVEALTGYQLPAWSGALPLFAILDTLFMQEHVLLTI